MNTLRGKSKHADDGQVTSQLHWAGTLVVFGGARDHYQVAVALQETDDLAALVTELYIPAMPKLVRGLIALMDPKGRRKSRANAALPASLVVISWPAFLASLCNRVYPSERFVRWKDAALGRKCGELAVRHNRPVLAYSYYASYAFERMPVCLPKVIFQVHPHPIAVREILGREMEISPDAVTSLSNENEMRFPADVLQRLSDEAHQAGFVITPSSYAKSTLVSAGLSPERVAVVPYGIDTSVFLPKRFNSGTGRPLRIIFVGSLVQRKGLSYLLEAARRLADENVEFVLAGRGAIDRVLLEKYSDVPFRLIWNAPREKIVYELQQADLFVFPSLVESFAHVILEAMAVGLPVITTTNTAGPDLIEQGKTGFVGPIRDIGFLQQKIIWFIRNRGAVTEMGQACQLAASERTWAGFRQGIREALTTISY